MLILSVILMGPLSSSWPAEAYGPRGHCPPCPPSRRPCGQWHKQVGVLKGKPSQLTAITQAFKRGLERGALNGLGNKFF